MRNMAFSATKPQIRAGTKIVTRRDGWANLKPGELFCAIEKGQGLKKGEKVVRMAICRCISNVAEALTRLVEDPVYGKEEARKEGFPEMSGHQFAEFFLQVNPGLDPDCRPQRIEFEYVRFLP